MATSESQSRKKRGRYTKRQKGAQQAPIEPKEHPGASLLSAHDPEIAFHAHVAALSQRYLAAARRKLERPSMDGFTIGIAPKRERDFTGAAASALHLAQLETHLAVMVAMEAKGKLTGDEARTLPGLSREIRIVRAELGLAMFTTDGELADDDDAEIL